MINVIGLGYIGLPTALMLAANGNSVIGTDCNRQLIYKLKNGELTFEEKGMESIFHEAERNNISFTTEYMEAGTYIISVPTPYDRKTKKVDAAYIISAVRSVCRVCMRGAVLIIESTIPPGTIDRSVRPAIESEGLIIGEDLHIVHAPERIIPGNMMYELVHNSRTIGADKKEIGEQVKQIYGTFCKGEIVVTDVRTAEMTKVAENTYRDINIAFANELAKICRSDNLDVYEIIRIANKHPRVDILCPGPGVGGHCISVDPWFLIGDYPGLANLILAARKINNSMPEFVLERIRVIMDEHNISELSRVGLYGLTYKEDVDDIRESPTLQMLESMRNHLACGIKIYDPFIKEDIVPNQYHKFESFIEDIDLVVIMVGHSEIKQKLSLLNDKIILDTKNICPFPGTYKL